MMRTLTLSDAKCASLRTHATLNPHPEKVTDALFRVYPFFDPRDLLQVKYEMLRRVMIDGRPVGATATAFGFSREWLYQLRKRFESQGLAGLLPQRKGPRRAHKLSEDVLIFVLETLKAEPDLRTVNLPQRVAKEFGISVHLRSIEKALARRQKKHQSAMPVQVCHIQLFGAWKHVGSNTKSCVVRPWSQGRSPIATHWKWLSSSARGWRPGSLMSRLVFHPVLHGLICRPSTPKIRTAI
jgi:transposase